MQLVLVAVFVVAALAVALLVRDGGTAEPALDAAAVQQLVDGRLEAALEDLQSAPARSALVYEAILPSLVVVRSQGGTRTSSGGIGAGVIVSDTGAILTAHHVVAGATALVVVFADGTEARATVEEADPTKDIAVLSTTTKPEVIVPAVLGGGVRIGDEAYAVGHPLGLVGSLSAGVISGLDRTIPRPDGSQLEGLIQFDAAVNPGSSGGPLLDRNGRVVGIVTALADPARDGSFRGIGFAVPIATAGGAAGAPAR